MSRDSAKCRRIVVQHHAVTNPAGRKVLICHCCGAVIDVLTESKRWRADHIKRYAEGGEDTPENLFPICMDCDGGKGGKAAEDTKAVAKGKRVFDGHNGIKRSRNPMPGSRDSKWKRKMDGSVERR